MKRGFSMLEVLIVLSCLTLVVTCSLFVYETCIKVSHTAHKRTHESLELCRALYLMMHDLNRAVSISYDAWVLHDTFFIWPLSEGDCGYLLKNNQLIRSCGNYNYTHSLWHKRTQSLVASAVQNMHILPDIRDGKMCGMRIELQGIYNKYSLYCACGGVWVLS